MDKIILSRKTRFIDYRVQISFARVRFFENFAKEKFLIDIVRQLQLLIQSKRTVETNNSKPSHRKRYMKEKNYDNKHANYFLLELYLHLFLH